MDPIVIEPYDPGWAERFAAARDRVEPVLTPWIVRPVEHIGSTAVSGLAAKPIIDMLAVVEDVDCVDAAHDSLGELGWHYAPEPGDVEQRRRSWCAPTVARRTHHLHIVECSSGQWRSWLAFRDALRADPARATQYAELKRRLADRYGSDPNERDAYRRRKAAFIWRTLQQ